MALLYTEEYVIIKALGLALKLVVVVFCFLFGFELREENFFPPSTESADWPLLCV